jgi:hypothetical protein
VELRAQSGENS